MNFLKLFSHDLRCGLRRKRYLLMLPIFALACASFLRVVKGMPGITWMDWVFHLFAGMEPPVIGSGEAIVLPLGFLAVMGGALLVNLDFLIADLTASGQQVLIRCGSRRGWFLSKCLWNLVSCGVYFAGVLLVAAVFCLATGGEAALTNTPAAQYWEFPFTQVRPLSAGQCLLIGIALPYLTMAALSAAQMTLCLFCKPVLAFLSCSGALLVSLYFDAGWIPGSGAILIRTSLFGGSVEPGTAIIVDLALLLGSAIAGTIRFRKQNILSAEE